MSYRAFWQRRCRAAAAGAVLKPQGGNCVVLPMFTPDCVSFCEVSSHAANSKGRRLRFWGSHRRIQNLRCRKRPNFEQRGCFHQRAGPWCAGRLPGSASGQCGFMRRDWCRCPGRPLRRLASSCLAVFPAVRMPLPQIIWLVGLFLIPTPTAIIMPTKQSTPAAPIPATRTKAAVPGAATDQKS